MNKLKNLIIQTKKRIINKLGLYKINQAKITNQEEYNTFTQKNIKIIEIANSLNMELKEKKDTFGPLTYFKHTYKNFRIHIKKEILKSKKRGICAYCDKLVDFEYYFVPELHGDDVPFRGLLTCPYCNNFNRTRAMFYIIDKLIDNRQNLKIYCMEQITTFYNNLKKLYGINNEVIGSEFVSEASIPGSITNDIRHEDALSLSFDDNTLDFVISNDVYEHVPDIKKTFQEAYRVLKKGGYIMFTIPFVTNKNETVVRAKIENNELVLLMEKEIHGNPMSQEGSLAFYNFGWDILNLQKEIGFEDPHMVALCDKYFGHIDYTPIQIFVARK